MPQPGLQLYLRPRVTLNFDLRTPKIDRFMPLPCEDMYELTSKSVYSFTKCVHKHLPDERTDLRTTWEHCVCVWRRHSESCRAQITVWTVVQTVLTATFNSYGDRQISTSHKINTPELINKQFSVFDYVRERTLYTKFGRDPSTEGFLANGWNITKNIFSYLFVYNFFIWLTYRSDLQLIDLYAQ